MVSDARQLLDDQVKSLKELKLAAQFAYLSVSAFPSCIANSDTDRFASYLGKLLISHTRILVDCLEESEYLLNETEVVYVPLLIPSENPEGETACSGAHSLLFELGVLFLGMTDLKSGFQSDSKAFSNELKKTFQKDGIPSWLTSGPYDVYKELSALVEVETNEAIARLNQQFQVNSFQMMRDANELEQQSHLPKKVERKSKKEASILWLAQAMLFVQENPGWTDAKIAQKVGKNRSTLSRNKTYQAAAGQARSGQPGPPKGYVSKNTNTGFLDVESYYEDDPSEKDLDL